MAHLDTLYGDYMNNLSVVGIPQTTTSWSENVIKPNIAHDDCIGFKPPYTCDYTSHNTSCDMYPALHRPNGCWYMSARQKFLTYTLTIGTVALFGLIGNTLSIIVLMKDNSKNNSGVFLLKSLAFTDNTFLFIIMLYYSLWYGLLPYMDELFHYGYYELYLRSLPYVRNGADQLLETAQTAVIWMTLLLAVNRYIVVCHPLHVQRYCTVHKAVLQVSVVIISSIIFNIPNFCRNYLSYVTAYNFRTKQNETLRCIERNQFVRLDTFQLIYTKILSTLMLGLLPLLLLFAMNIKIILTIRRVRLFRKRSSNARGNRNIASLETNITIIMVTIVVVFIICQTADRTRFAVEPLRRYLTCNYPVSIAIINLFVVLNSSVNFIIYFLLRKSFRRILCDLVPLSWFYVRIHGRQPENAYTLEIPMTPTNTVRG